MVDSMNVEMLDAVCMDLYESSKTRTTTVTWLNHYSALVSLENVSNKLSSFHYVGIDGLLLCHIVGGVHRSSADLLIPRLLQFAAASRVLLIGSTSAKLQLALSRLRSEHPTVDFFGMDGYEGLLRGISLVNRIDDLSPSVVIVGLGPGLQDEVASLIAESPSPRLIVTCGGFIDQLALVGYYPKWAYPLRLNWLIRVVREPRRLWRRYTLDAARAVLERKVLKERIERLEGFHRMRLISSR